MAASWGPKVPVLIVQTGCWVSMKAGFSTQLNPVSRPLGARVQRSSGAVLLGARAGQRAEGSPGPLARALCGDIRTSCVHRRPGRASLCGRAASLSARSAAGFLEQTICLCFMDTKFCKWPGCNFPSTVRKFTGKPAGAYPPPTRLSPVVIHVWPLVSVPFVSFLLFHFCITFAPFFSWHFLMANSLK